MNDENKSETAMTIAEPAAQPISIGALQATTGSEMIASGSEMATALASVIESRKLYATIQGRRHVTVEGWTTLSTMLGCLPQEESNDEQEDGSYVAVVALVRVSDGQVLTRASSLCGDASDRPWNQRPKYARRSMAATRATGKACRLAFSWVMTLAGYAPTPAEEMPREPEPVPQRTHTSSAAGGPSPAQLKRLRAIAKESGWTDDQTKAAIHAMGVESSRDLSRGQYDRLCDEILPVGPVHVGEVV